ncbi:hypothetical protein [Glycomyces artemisiae]|nr:hypothetical protein [Glycomyces artemisiae]
MAENPPSDEWKKVTALVVGGAFVLGVVVDATTALGWIGVGPDADKPTGGAETATTGDYGYATQDYDPDEVYTEEEWTEQEWTEEDTWEDASGWVEESAGLTMTLSTDFDGDGACLRYLYDFDDLSYSPEVWYETTTDLSTTAGYVDLVWDPCDIDPDSQVTGTSYLYNSGGDWGTFYDAGANPSAGDCDSAVVASQTGMSWSLDPWAPSAAPFVETMVLCTKTTEGRIVLVTVDSVVPEDGDSWFSASMSATTYTWV